MASIFTFNQGCSSQDGNNTLIDRKPAVAGQFYPASPTALRETLADLFSKAKPRTVSDVVAVISPHAGYVFSGIVAASSFNQIDPDKEYENVFVIASSHQVSFFGASVYNKGDYVTPLGKVKVNLEIANKLIQNTEVFTFNAEADRYEHSVEVQIPFLQYHLKHPFRLVPIIIGSQSATVSGMIAKALKPYLTPRNLFVFSSDFSHYPSYTDAQVADKATCDAILTNNPEKLLYVLDQYKNKDIPNLATSLCGWTSVVALLNMTTGDPDFKYTAVHYMNSGDSKFADRSKVVGYWAIAVSNSWSGSKTAEVFSFSDQEKKTLLAVARNTIKTFLTTGKRPEPDTIGYSPNLRMHTGAFVTLKKHGELRGCIGRFTADIPLYAVVQEMAIASSTQDTRFDPVSSKEVGQLEIEISVLSPMRKITSINEIILGRHGIYIKKGWRSGTFLPQVATETGWSKEEFLGYCARDKAGIGWDGWKDAELYVYEACVFSEKDFSDNTN